MEDLDLRFDRIEKRLNAIETKLKIGTESIVSNSNEAALSKQETEVEKEPQPLISPTRSEPPQFPRRDHLDLPTEPLDSSSVLAWIGIFFVILAGVFFIKLTVESGWLTPIRQVLLASATGLTFFLLPHFVAKAEREYSALLAGAGTTILHLTWLGAYFHHQIIGQTVALVCATVVGAFSVIAHFEKARKTYLLVAMAGTYLAAPLVGYQLNDFSTLSIFLIIWNVSFSASAFLTNRRDILFIASYYAAFTVLLLSGKAVGPDLQFELLLLQLIQFLIFSVAMLTFSIVSRVPLTASESGGVLPLLLLFYISTNQLIANLNPGLANWFGLIIGGFMIGLYFLARKFLSDQVKSGPALTAFSAITFVHSVYFQLTEEELKPLVGLIFAVLAFVIWKQSAQFRQNYSRPLLILLSTFVYGAILTVVSPDASNSMFYYNWAYGFVGLFAAITLSSQRTPGQEVGRFLGLLLGFGHLEVMLGFYRFSTQFSVPGALFLTVTWGLYAASVLAFAYYRRDQILGKSALTILVAVSLKAFFYDLASTGSLVRVGCLLGEGLLLYGCGWIFKKMQLWQEQKSMGPSNIGL